MRSKFRLLFFGKLEQILHQIPEVGLGLTMHEPGSPNQSEEDPDSPRPCPLHQDGSSFTYSYSFTYPCNMSRTYAVPTHVPAMVSNPAPPTPHVPPQHADIQGALPHQVFLRLSLALHLSLSLSLSSTFPAFYHEKMTLLTVGQVCVCFN